MIKKLQLIFLFISLILSSGIYGDPVFHSIEVNNDTVQKYEKFELTIDLSADFYNPYDYNQIVLKCIFVSPSGNSYTIYGFYYQDFIMTSPDVLEPNGDPLWKIRFCPDETGLWNYEIICFDISGSLYYPIQQFYCESSDNPGFVHRAGDNKLRFDNGDLFFGIGLNMAWGGWDNGFTIYDQWTNELQNNGGNLIKITMVPWGFSIEWEETGVGNYDARQDRAYALDWVLDKLIEKNIYCQLNFSVHEAFKEEGFYMGWEKNPYNNQNGGPCHEPQNFFVNPDAINYYKRRLKYINARWGYSPNIQSWELISEADNTGYYDDFRTIILNWLNQMTEYTKSIDQHNRPVSTGFAIPEHDPDYWNQPSVDFTQLHIYGLIPDLELKLYNYTQFYSEEYNKPVIVGEFGLGHSPEEIIAQDPTGISFHNCLWTTALSGAYSTGLSWWWDNYIYPMNLFGHFYPLSNFFSNISFLQEDLQQQKLFCTSEYNYELKIKPDFFKMYHQAPANNFIIEPNGSIIPNEMNLGTVLYGYFFNAYRNPPSFHVNYTKPGEFTVATGGTGYLSNIKIWLDGNNLINQTASTNSIYTINVPPGEHLIFVENTGNGFMEIDEYRLTNYAPVLRSFVLRNNKNAAGWFQNRKYNYDYINQNGYPPEIENGQMFFEDFEPGVYQVDWYNGSFGSFDSSSFFITPNGNITLETPEVLWDGAYQIRFQSSFNVDFTADITEGDAPLTVQFTDQTSSFGNPVNFWLWDFGDGNFSNVQNPNYTFETPGIYDVSLKVGNGQQQDSLKKTNYITVHQPLVADFIAQDTSVLLCAPVIFVDLSLGSPTSWNWEFGDNLFSSQQNPVHFYQQPGFYTVTLIIEKDDKTDIMIKQDYIEIYTSLIADFKADTTFALTGQEIQFTDLSEGNPTEWFWNFGDEQMSNEKNPAHNYENPGIYTVQLKVKSGSREDSITKENYITIVVPLIADFKADTTFALTNQEIQFTDLSEGNPIEWFWNFGDEQMSNEKNPVHNYENPGIYTVKLKVISGLLEDSIAKENYITIVVPLIADFEADTTFALTGQEIQFTDLSAGNPAEWFWNFGDGHISNEKNPVHNFGNPGIFTIKLKVISGLLEDSITKENYITIVDTLIANFEADTTFAWTGQEIQFTDLSTGGPTAWWWNFGDLHISQLQNPVHVYEDEGVYTVGLVVINEFQNDYEFKLGYITIKEPLVADFTADTTKVLIGQNVHFTDISSGFPTSWAWDFGDQINSPYQNPEHNYSNPGSYSVTLQVSDEDSTDFIVKENFISVRDSLIADFFAIPTSIYAGGKVNFYDLSTSDPSYWKWSFGDGRTALIQNPFYTYHNPGIYSVTLVVENEFDIDSLTKVDFITVIPTPISQTLNIPEGWSAVSSYVIPVNPELEIVFYPIMENLIIAVNETGIFWPSQSVNTIGEWNEFQGMIVKVSENSELEIGGIEETGRILKMHPGWNIMPVLCSCPESTSDLAGDLGDTLIIIKEIAGTKVYWPAPGIFTLDQLLPGKAYYTLLEDSATVTFNECLYKTYYPENNDEKKILSPWSKVSQTPNSHIIGVLSGAFEKIGFEIKDGDIVGVFNKNNICSGYSQISFFQNHPDAFALSAFKAEESNKEQNGFCEFEEMRFKLFRNQTGETIVLLAEFSQNYPNSEFFVPNGISAIEHFSGPEGLSYIPGIYIYPNPTLGIMNLYFENIYSKVELKVYSADGKILLQKDLYPEYPEKINLANRPKGIYYLHFRNSYLNIVRKIVLR